MVEMTDFRIPLNSRVSLRDGLDPNLYNGFGVVGSQGWIKKHKVDEFGYPHVYIQWDKDHWAYNGAPDGWTWEDHFNVVEVNMKDNKDKELATRLLDMLREYSSEDEEVTSDEDAAEDFVQAQQMLEDADSFVLVTAHRMRDGVRLRGANHFDSTESELVICLQLAAIGASNYKVLVSEKLDELD